MKKNGKWKEYYNTGKLKFEGEYVNEKMWNGKKYKKNGEVKYEIKDGEIANFLVSNKKKEN